MRRRAPLRRRLRNAIMIVTASGVVVMINAAPVSALSTHVVDGYRTSRPSYIATHGRWETIQLPEGVEVNAIHAALLSTGKILVIAGSGNDREQFEAGTFTSLLWDPETKLTKVIPTPEDLFCAGHAFLPDGKVLIAGGTRAYEKLAPEVTNAAGGMTVKNEDPDAGRTLPVGTVFTSATGLRYATTYETEIPPADKMDHGGGHVMITPSETPVWVEALEAGEAAVVDEPGQYQIEGLRGAAAENIYGMADAMTLEKQDFQGLDASWTFDPVTEQYEPTGRLQESRWYPTLVGVGDGDVLAVSGLDEDGKILQGQNEVYADEDRAWTAREDLTRYFPTYPSLFRMADDRLFYSGSNAGYGPADEGRAPGIWDLTDNAFTPVAGLRDGTLTETSSSVLLPPAQDQKVMIVGGGGVGDSAAVTARTDVIDLDAEVPAYAPGPDLAHAVRYPSAVTLPDDSVLITGGSSDYRGRGESDVLSAQLYHPETGTFTEAASPRVGRNYHSESLLLPDGSVVTLGSDPLFGDEEGTVDGDFEQRIEVYSPPYLSRDDRPELTTAPDEVTRGTTIEVATPDAASIDRARLIRPSAVTHVTDTEQRSVALDVTAADGSLSLAVPEDEGLLPSGWYMLFLVDDAGTPSVGRWVHVA